MLSVVKTVVFSAENAEEIAISSKHISLFAFHCWHIIIIYNMPSAVAENNCGHIIIYISLIKHIELLETVQRRTTKFILNNFELDYKSRLVHLNLLPLMLWYELAGIMFLVKCIKNPDSRLKISKYITFSTTNARSASFLKLSHYHHSRTNSISTESAGCGMLFPPIDLNLSSNTIKAKIKNYLWSFFVENFNPHITCSFTLHVHVPNVCCYLCQPTILHVRSCNVSVWLLYICV